MRMSTCHPDRTHESKGLCKSCYTNFYNKTNPDKKKAQNARYRKSNPDKKKATAQTWRKANIDNIKSYNSARYKNNPDKAKVSNAMWRKANPGKMNAKNARRRAAKFNATPEWLTKKQLLEIEEFYIEAVRLTKETGIKHQVDHKEPLQSKDVCGLHVPWNLQILTAEENIRKGNKIKSR